MSNVTPEDIDAVCGLVDDLCGIYWDASKAYLIESRLSQLVRKTSCANYADLVRKVRAAALPGLREEVINAVTTNETLWFRDTSPFEALRHKVIPHVIDGKAKSLNPRRLRIWSAASSTGQEAYSIAMAFADVVYDYQNWDFKVFGTDISPAAVAQASRGVYNKLEISRGLDVAYRDKYFIDQGDSWLVRDSIRSMCSFAVRNLHEPFTGLGPFDVVFCRNVAIYFNAEDRAKLFEKLAATLTPEGWLFAGSSESLSDLGARWAPQQHCRATCYQPNLAQAYQPARAATGRDW
ncbi:MAG: protein-glutamate O-methyltransferase CheR [Pirellulales bacterium]|nr:protein-glutamate O-methyltransferase CheR [Pirellulales bacterium]